MRPSGSVMKALFAVLAILLFVGVIGTQNNNERKLITIAYVTTIAGIVALFVIDMVVAVCL